MEKFLFILGALIIGVLAVVGVSALLALPVMWLWNGVVVDLFTTGTVKPVGFWNAWGLLILCGLLFKTHVTTSKSE